MKTILLAAALAAGNLSTAQPALARDSKAVALADLDLSNPAGRAAALVRIRRVAAELCREIPPEGVDRLRDHLKFRDCVNRATDAAAAQLPAG